MFYQNGIPIAISSFQVKHIIVREKHRELIEHNGVYQDTPVDRYFIDSNLYYYNSPIHRLCRHSILESDIDEYKGTLKDRKIADLLDTQVKPSLIECNMLLALHTSKEKLKRIFG